MRGELAMYEIRTIENIAFEDLADTWNLAFSDYIVPMNMTAEGLSAYFKVAGVDRSQSFGAFQNNTLVGMLLNSVDSFRGERTAYDAMTGIVPQHRGKGLFTQLFEQTKNSLKSNGIKNYYLEVIKTNENAYSIYKNKGGKTEREFLCICGRIDNKFESVVEVKVSPLSDYLDSKVSKSELSVYEPSWSNRVVALHRNIDDYQVAYIEDGSRKVAAIFNKWSGGIPQIMFNGIDDKDLLRAVFTCLSQKFDSLSISNIPSTETELISELLNIGFKVLVEQYEMKIDL